MYILIILCVAFLVGITGLIRSKDRYSTPIGYEIMTFVSSIGLVVFFILWPLMYQDTRANIEEYKAFSSTIQQARIEKMSELERATILKDVAKWNQWIARKKFQNKNFHYDFFIPDEINDVKPM